MPNPVKEPLVTPGDIATAMALLTRAPIRADFSRGARAAWAWSLVGIATGLIVAIVGSIAMALGLPPVLAALLALTAQIFFTGALHEDGLADVADGFWGGFDPARRLEIMKDSRIGAYGVIALVLSLLARAAALTTLLASAPLFATLIAVGVMSRAPMAVIMAILPPARATGLAHQTGRPSRETAALGAGLAIIIALVLLGPSALAPILVISLTTIGLAAIAKAKIGGHTGDVAGANQQLAEIAALFALAAAFG